MEDSAKQIHDDDKSLTQTGGAPTQKVVSGEFETYLLNALNDSLIKKSKFTSIKLKKLFR